MCAKWAVYHRQSRKFTASSGLISNGRSVLLRRPQRDGCRCPRGGCGKAQAHGGGSGSKQKKCQSSERRSRRYAHSKIACLCMFVQKSFLFSCFSCFSFFFSPHKAGEGPAANAQQAPAPVTPSRLDAPVFEPIVLETPAPAPAPSVHTPQATPTDSLTIEQEQGSE